MRFYHLGGRLCEPHFGVAAVLAGWIFCASVDVKGAAQAWYFH